MQCPACGVDNGEGARFCMSCGSALEAAAPPPPEAPPTFAPPAPPAPAPPAPGPVAEPVADAEPPADLDAGAELLAVDEPIAEVAEASAPEPETVVAAEPVAAAPAPVPPPPVAPPPPGGYAPPPPPQGYAPPPPPGPPAYAPPAPPQGYAPPPPAPAPYAAPPSPVGVPDPNQLGAAIARSGNSTRKATKVAVAIAGALLAEGEVVEAVVGGKLEGNAAVVVLTDRGLLLVDDRQWKPFTERLTVDPGLQVAGWQDDRTASLTFVVGGRQLVVDQIGDRPLAVEMAQRIRYRTGASA